MTSFYARHGTLSRQTRESLQYYTSPRNAQDILRFYMDYLLDVVPLEVTVQHVPSSSDTRGTREEIQLLTPSRRIWMTGFVSKELNPDYPEHAAGSEAYNKWEEGYFVADGGNWRFFTGLAQLRFYKNDQRNTWKITENFYPMDSAQSVSEFLQEQYENLSHHQRFS